MRGKWAVFPTAAIVISAATVFAQTEEIWTCTEVIDGDTIRVEAPDGKSRVVHLYGIDAPELKQARGIEAREFIENITLQKEINLEVKEQQANAWIVVLSVDEIDIATELAGAGLAWLSKDGATTDDYAIAVFIARQNKKSLWSDEKPLHPSDWRRENAQPLPTPTPPPDLSDFAASTTIEKNDGEAIVISDIPSVYARNRETMTFFETMTTIAVAAFQITKMEAVHSQYCSSGSDFSGVVGEGTVWSEDMGDWVQGEGTRLGEACLALAVDIERGQGFIQTAKAEALDTARRFGVKEDIIREIVDYFDLDQY